MPQVAEAKYEFFENEWKNISAEAKDMIAGLLVVDPTKRLTMAQLLEHPWVKSAVTTCRTRMEQKAAEPPSSTAAAAPPASGEAQATVKGDKDGGAPACSGCVLL